METADPPLSVIDPTTPAHFDERTGGWNVYRHADVTRVLFEADTFGLGFVPLDQLPQAHPTFAGMWQTDGQRHRDLRALVAEPFRPRVLEEIEPLIRQAVDSRLDAALTRGDGRLELVGELAEPVPAVAICHILGVDTGDAAKMVVWMDELAETVLAADFVQPQPEMTAYFLNLVDQRRRRPQVGVVDELIAAQAAGTLIDGRELTDWDLIGYLSMLLAAGTETVTAGIGNMMLYLTEFDLLDRLRAEPGLRDRAIEETLRWRPPFPCGRRYTRQATVLAGHELRVGDPVNAWISAANRDPGQFDAPDVFRVDRPVRRNLAFGVGPHYCLGAGLARLELRVVLDQILERCTRFERDLSRPVVRRHWMVDSARQAYFRAA